MTICQKGHRCGRRRRREESLISPLLRWTIPDLRRPTPYRVNRKSFYRPSLALRLGVFVVNQITNQTAQAESNQNQTGSNQKSGSVTCALLKNLRSSAPSADKLRLLKLKPHHETQEKDLR